METDVRATAAELEVALHSSTDVATEVAWALANEFAKEAVPRSVWSELEDSDLRDMGVHKLGHRKNLLTYFRSTSAHPNAFESAPQTRDAPDRDQPAKFKADKRSHAPEEAWQSEEEARDIMYTLATRFAEVVSHIAQWPQTGETVKQICTDDIKITKFPSPDMLSMGQPPVIWSGMEDTLMQLELLWKGVVSL